MKNFMISPDWLQMHVYLHPYECKVFKSDKWKATLLRQTKVFKEVWGITDLNGVEIGTLCLKANENILPKYHGVFKVANNILYNQDIKTFVPRLLQELGLVFVSITRLDIALDFLEFENGYPPETFIEDIFNGRVIRNRNATVDFSTEQRKGKMVRKGMSIGTYTSDIRFSLYNKTLEMEQKYMKPYIKLQHDEIFGPGATVWRLELSISSFNMTFGDAVKAEGVSQLEYLDGGTLYGLFFSMLESRFIFRHAEGPDRMTRKEKITLLTRVEGSDILMKPLNICRPELEKSNRMEKILISKLNDNRVQFEKVNKKFSEACEIAMNEMIKRHGLQYWADCKGMPYMIDPPIAMDPENTIEHVREVRKYSQMTLFTH